MSRAMTQQEAKTMVAAFRVSELQMFLGFVGANRLGRKDDLVARAWQIIDGRNFNDRIKSKIKELYDTVNASAQVPPVPQAMPTVNGIGGRGGVAPGMMGFQPNGGQLRQNSLGAAALQLRQTQQGVSMPVAAQLDMRLLKMTDLPFYEVIDVVYQPTCLTPLNANVKVQESRVQFILKPDQINAITHVRDTRPGVALDYPVQLQLRLCLANTSAVQQDAFPGSFNAKLNAKPLPLPPANPSNRQGVEPKRTPKPVNLTGQAKLSPVVANYLDITWGYEPGKFYAFQICVVRKLLPDELLMTVKARKISKDVTKKRIREILDPDSEIRTDSLRLGLRCPLGRMRMTLPCRAYPGCSLHVQCFDATMFIQMNEKKASWACPVCHQPAAFDELAIDEYFAEVLASSTTKECDEVELNVDGEYFPIVVDDEGKKEVKRVKQPAEEKTEAKDEVKGEVKDVKPGLAATSAAAAGTGSGENGRETPPLVELSDDENDENVAPPPRSPEPAAAPAPPPPPAAPVQPSEAPVSPEVLTIDDD